MIDSSPLPHLIGDDLVALVEEQDAELPWTRTSTGRSSTSPRTSLSAAAHELNFGDGRFALAQRLAQAFFGRIQGRGEEVPN